MVLAWLVLHQSCKTWGLNSEQASTCKRALNAWSLVDNAERLRENSFYNCFDNLSSVSSFLSGASTVYLWELVVISFIPWRNAFFKGDNQSFSGIVWFASSLDILVFEIDFVFCFIEKSVEVFNHKLECLLIYIMNLSDKWSLFTCLILHV